MLSILPSLSLSSSSSQFTSETSLSQLWLDVCSNLNPSTILLSMVPGRVNLRSADTNTMLIPRKRTKWLGHEVSFTPAWLHGTIFLHDENSLGIVLPNVSSHNYNSINQSIHFIFSIFIFSAFMAQVSASFISRCSGHKALNIIIIIRLGSSVGWAPAGLYLCVRKRSVRPSSRPADSKKFPSVRN